MYNKDKKIGEYKKEINKYLEVPEEVYDKMTISELKRLARKVALVESLCNEVDTAIAQIKEREG